MERIAALMVRWGLALSLVAVIGYFLAQSIVVTPSDGVGVELGLAIIAAALLLLFGLLVSIGALGLWYALISKRSESRTRFENERIIGTAFVLLLGGIAALFV